MSGILLTQNSTFIIGDVARILGWIMSVLFNFLDSVFGIQNIGLCIILFTAIIYLLMLPLTIKQQKFSKLSAKMNPEIQEIQKKYKNKKDNDSMMAMNEETQAVYAKYGVSPTGSCLQLLIQLPILLSLYRVIMNVPAYVSGVKNVFTELAGQILAAPGGSEFMQEMATNGRLYIEGKDFGQVNTIIDGINIANSPWNIAKSAIATGSFLLLLGAVLVPLLAALTQWLNVKLMPQPSTGDENSTMNSTMKTMNMTMPLMSAWFCFTLPSGMGLYWIAGAVIRGIQQWAINKYMNKLDLDEIVKKNIEKNNRIREKKGLPPQKITDIAKTNVKTIENSKNKRTMTEEERMAAVEASTNYYKNSDKPGSLASKAAMVAKYNEKSKK